MRQHPVEIVDGVTTLSTSVEEQDHWPPLGRFGVITDRNVDQILASLARDLAFVTLPQQLRLATATGLASENDTWGSQPRGYAENGDGEHSCAIASGTDSNSCMTMHKQMFPYPATTDNFGFTRATGGRAYRLPTRGDWGGSMIMAEAAQSGERRRIDIIRQAFANHGSVPGKGVYIYLTHPDLPDTFKWCQGQVA